MIDEAEFLAKNLNLNKPLTIECPVKQCKETFTGTAAEILIKVSKHYGKYHEDNK